MPGGSRRSADHRLAELLAAGLPLDRAARQVQISYATAKRRVADPVFRAEVRSIRQRARDSALGQLSDGMLLASLVLRRLLQDDDPRIQLRAAIGLLDQTRSWADLVE